MAKVGLVGLVLLVAQLGAGCGGGKGNGSGTAGQVTSGVAGGGGSGPGIGGGGGSGGSSGGSYGWVEKPGAGYTVNAIWGDQPDSLWAVTSGGQLLFYDGATWQFVFGGALPALYSVWGLPGQTDIYLVGLSSQFYLVRGANVFDLGAIASGDNMAVWAARGDQVWVGSDTAAGGLRRYDLTVATPTATFDGPSDLQGVRAIWGATADDVWLIDGTGALVHRQNQTWARDTSIPSANPRLTGIHGKSTSDVWAVGPYGLFHWNGSQWTEIDQGHNAGLFAVWAVGASEAWVVGDGGWTVHVTPTSYQGLASGTASPLFTVWGTSPTDIWTGGQDGVLLHYEPTTGGGTPDAGPSCKQQGEGCGPGDCCAPYNCRLIAGVTLCG